MLSLQTIVVPTDSSDTARNALRMARELASKDSHIHLVHVIPDLLQVPWLNDDAGIAYYTDMEESWKAKARERLESLAGEERLDAGQVVVAAFMGHPAQLILKYAEEQQADLIVMGAHGQSAVTRFLLGSVADRVVRHAGRPVLTVPRPGTDGFQPLNVPDASRSAPADATHPL